MSDIAIKIDGLGKKYLIGARQSSKNSFRDVLGGAMSAPFRRANLLLRGQAYGAAGLTETIWALKDISFEVNSGEVVGIIGRNGAGKSTLLKILSSITDPTEGRAEIYGRVGALLEVGTGFHSELTGRENVYLNGAILGMSRREIDSKFDEIVAFAEVEKFIDTPVKHYSSGMGLRLGFAVAAHLEPEILIVDEVLAVGDAAFQKKCLGKMSDVAGEGRTVLFVSHNMATINNLCNRVIILEQGQTVFDGSTMAAIDKYLEEDTPHALSADLTDPKIRRAGIGKARFESVAITAGDGEARAPRTGDDIQVQVSVRCYRPIEEATLWIAVLDSVGNHVIDITTSMYKQFIDMQPGESRQWTFRLKNVLLRPATYHLDVGIVVERYEAIDFVYDSLYFEVNLNPALPNASHDYSAPYRCAFEVAEDNTQPAISPSENIHLSILHE